MTVGPMTFLPPRPVSVAVLYVSTANESALVGRRIPIAADPDEGWIWSGDAASWHPDDVGNGSPS